MAQRRVRNLMETEMFTEDLRLIKIAGENRTSNYNQAFEMFEWGREWFTHEGSRAEHNMKRNNHYQKLELEFEERTNNPHSIRRYTGFHETVFNELCANPQVAASAEASVAAYRRLSPPTYHPVPMTVRVLLMIALNYLDTGSNYKQMASLWQVPKISKLINAGKEAIGCAGNIRLPTRSKEWLTSALGFERKHGLPNVVASLDITPIFCLHQQEGYYCPRLRRSCVKVATLMDASGKYLDYKVFPGNLQEPEMLEQWPFYQRLKATEAQIRLPGVDVNPRQQGVEPLEEYPHRLLWPAGQYRTGQTTAAGIIVDGRYASAMCSLFVAPSQLEMLIFDQRVFRTRMFHEQQFGILTQFCHIKQRMMPMESSHHDMESSVLAMLTMMNFRLSAPNNPEHACISFCTSHREISDEEAVRLVDTTPYPAESIRGAMTVSRVLADFCENHLASYSMENIQYLLRQLKWPEFIVRDQAQAPLAFHRELMRVLQFRADRFLPRVGVGFERPPRALLAHVRDQWQREGIVEIAAENAEEMARAYNENEDGDGGDDLGMML